MKKILSTLSCIAILSGISNANECVCFELKGEFGEEIKAILQKYSKNLGSKDIKVVREDADLTLQERSFLDSLLGTGSVASNTRGHDVENGKRLYDRDCANCHGKKAEIRTASKPPINTWKLDDIASEIKTYQNQSFEGQSRFVKNQVAQRYTKRDMEDIGAYIETLK
ncbi:c-type cytochrome [Helicobacter sp. MIT 05-5294]|uniref:c-type cytochrome n=1 Tax=Helicobacter sp. MIT 05-5294 TaxID=1548150 RepID=UPI00051FAD4E|nr:c-type cytochrome [Helicobacter sp. MIT 05-5294]TLD89274.1 c-type cytochrome [Helicobacter sp. MIT 05-5294]